MLHLQEQKKIKQETKRSMRQSLAGFLFGLLFDSEDRGSVFLRTFSENRPDYRAEGNERALQFIDYLNNIPSDLIL
jgi:hypothetical protein